MRGRGKYTETAHSRDPAAAPRQIAMGPRVSGRSFSDFGQSLFGQTDYCH